MLNLIFQFHPLAWRKIYHFFFIQTAVPDSALPHAPFFRQVIIIDPISRASAPPLKLGETLLKHATPVRVGLILAPVPGRMGDELALESAVRSAFNYVAQEKNSNKEAFQFLAQVRKLGCLKA